MSKIAAVGDYDSIIGLQAIGIEISPASTQDEIRTVLHSLARRDDVSIIFVTEQAAVLVRDDIEIYKDRLSPAIILIPGKEGSLGIGSSNLKASIERAVGVDIISPTIEQ